MSKLYVMVILFFLSLTTFSQVGINTTSPEGILDVSSTTQGLVLPRVALTATNVSAPVINPKDDGAPIPGTTVYNTNPTTNGANDVYLGNYVWNGMIWVAQFDMKQSEIFEQTDHDSNDGTDNYFFRVSADNDNTTFEDIPGLTAQSFTARYTGKYRIEMAMTYGSGLVRVPATTHSRVDIVAGQGFFKFTFNGVDYTKYVNCHSAYTSTTTNGAATPTHYFAIYRQANLVKYVNLTAGQTYNFNVSFDQFFDARLQNNGSSGNGRGVVGTLSPGTVEISFIEPL